MMGSNFGFLRRSVKRAVAAKRNGASRLAFWRGGNQMRSPNAQATLLQSLKRKFHGKFCGAGATRLALRDEKKISLIPRSHGNARGFACSRPRRTRRGHRSRRRPGCALRLARYLASARVRPPALRVAARSGFHHSSHDPGNGRIDRDNRETDALIVMTEGNPEPGPEAEIAAKVLARHPKLFPTPTRSARVRNTKSRSAARFKKKCAGER